jgi:hypothetical protein
MVEQQEEYDELLESYEGMAGFFGAGDDFGSEGFSFVDEAFFVQTQFVIWMILVLGAVVMVQAFNAFTNAERDGTLDLMMSYPVTRRQYLLARIGNTVVTILVLLTASFIPIWFSTFVIPEFEMNVGDILLGIYPAFFIVMVPATFSYMVVAFIPSSRRFAGALTYTLFFGSYVIYGLITSIDMLKDFDFLFIFKYYSFADIVKNGLDFGNMLVLVTLSLIFGGIAYWQIDHKELSV